MWLYTVALKLNSCLNKSKYFVTSLVVELHSCTVLSHSFRWRVLLPCPIKLPPWHGICGTLVVFLTWYWQDIWLWLKILCCDLINLKNFGVQSLDSLLSSTIHSQAMSFFILFWTLRWWVRDFIRTYMTWISDSQQYLTLMSSYPEM